MSLRPVELPGPLALVLGRELLDNTRRKVADHPALPADPKRWQADLETLVTNGAGVPATFLQPKRVGDLALDVALLGGGAPDTFEQHGAGDGPALVLHVGSYIMLGTPVASAEGANGEERHRAYTITDVSPQRPHDYDRLADGCLLLRPTAWVVAPGPGQEPVEAVEGDAYWSTLTSAYETLGREQVAELGSSPVSSEQHAFLDRVDQLIDAAEAITGHDEGASAGGDGSRRVGATSPVTALGTGFRTSFGAQRAAVNQLRTGQSPNTGLLPALADGRVLPLLTPRLEPTEPLDRPQREAFRKAASARDLLLVEAPPGTGKTRTISQIIRASAESGERILVTSDSSQWLDRLLSRLPPDLLAIHLDAGADGDLDTSAGAIAERLRQQVTNRTHRSLASYDRLDDVVHLAAELDRLVDELGSAKQEESRAREALDRARRSTGGQVQARVEDLIARRDRLAADLRQAKVEIEDLIERRRRAREKTGTPVLGRLVTAQVHRYDQRLSAMRSMTTAGRREHHQLGRELAAAERDRDTSAEVDPGVLACTEALAEVTAHCDAHHAAANQTSQAARQALDGLSLGDLALASGGTDDEWQALTELREWLTMWLPVLIARRRLLGEWADEMAGATSDQLAPELARYAQVIATDPGGSTDGDVDLVIIDGAGKLGLTDVLVPLVRAGRAVLFGDHLEVPPFLGSEVGSWGGTVHDPEIRKLLAMSPFERLTSDQPVPDSNIVRLKTQRRMPPAIASFISTTFYNGSLDNGASGDNTAESFSDELSDQALVFIDTSGLPTSHRFESQRSEVQRRGQRRDRREGERWGLPGYINVAEAEMLIRLAVFYHRRCGAEGWAVVVPYKAQAAKITGMLGRLINNVAAAERNVGTIDGGGADGCPVVLFGFTHSNSDGDVGLLTEPRWTARAFTRAEQRLVLVGDLSTLTNASDKPFRKLARSFRRHLADVGDLTTFTEIDHRLTEADRQGRGDRL